MAYLFPDLTNNVLSQGYCRNVVNYLNMYDTNCEAQPTHPNSLNNSMPVPKHTIKSTYH